MHKMRAVNFLGHRTQSSTRTTTTPARSSPSVTCCC